ncbi:TraX protein [Acetitomaculum ruminis DSM 5522]|uniref:TraX protein n=1 Tax=Acetitomaculum ruminis DSM 5522 TaxID=1120918 RepID=A0A1I1A1F4_9FIRM|nr:TraX family protein [Acetitomaculum ruminis]SFB31784.1 TraX protein [Acetitomaculum ruminis DSM 5522]
METKGINSNQLKVIALAAMTIDHLTSVIWMNYPTDWWIILLHIIGRLAAPIFWFMIAEGYHYTHDLKKYGLRLLIFAVIGHFAYNFAFGIPFLPFKSGVFNQTSVIWPLFLGLIGLWVSEKEELKKWQKDLIILLLTLLAFCADWSSIAVLAVINIGTNRENFKKQMTMVMLWVAVYAIVYAIFVNPIYGLLQLFVCLTIPLLKAYNGKRGKMKNMKYLFYIYYPAHLILCGVIRILLHGNVGVMIGG